MVPSILLSLSLGLISNLVAELFLTLDLGQPFSSLSPSRRRLRITRWVISWLGLILVSATGLSPVRLLLVALFGISASTDLETRYLPPDWFIYGATFAGCLGGYALGGVSGLRDAVVAQAVCFTVMVFGILLAGVADSGDIKLLMQYGTACGALPVVAVGTTIEFAVRLAILVTMVVATAVVRRQPWREAFRRVAGLKHPHGPVAWVGLLAALAFFSPLLMTWWSPA
jgi:hypothetical protein